MWQALYVIDKSVSKDGIACFVVQPSFYKEIFVDLPELMIELVGQLGFSLEEMVYFDSKRSMVAVNKKANAAAAQKAVEAAVIMKRRVLL